MLLVRVLWPAQGESQRERDEQAPRGVHFFSMFPDRHDGDRCQTKLLKYPRKHAYSVRAERSNGSQEHDVHPFGLQAPGYLRPRLTDHWPSVALRGPMKRVEVLRQATDHPSFHHLP
jgi:hypothetical protein